ncbi:hypothetical protein AMECASPLE_021408 [Ameca splendens]|uniref:Uncharacterized protein n=1 Tax=Ameca splendens TaxID=208324 RepID=A0ABV0YQF8_9TELE
MWWETWLSNLSATAEKIEPKHPIITRCKPIIKGIKFFTTSASLGGNVFIIYSFSQANPQKQVTQTPAKQFSPKENINLSRHRNAANTVIVTQFFHVSLEDKTNSPLGWHAACIH